MTLALLALSSAPTWVWLALLLAAVAVAAVAAQQTPTILDIAALIARQPGFEMPAAMWRATLAFFYGLPLTAADVEALVVATKLSAAAIRVRSQQGPFRELWCRIGRRGWKTSIAALICLFEACFGGHERYLIPGERGLIACISKDIAGSTAVARLVELFAGALGIKCNWTSMGSVRILELEGYALAVACFPCSAKTPRGYAVPIVVADEIAHWATDADEYTNSDEAVLGAIKPAMAQFPNSKLICISSPLGQDGIFHETVEAHLGSAA